MIVYARSLPGTAGFGAADLPTVRTGAAVTGWIIFAQGYDEALGSIVFPLGLIATLVGVVGVWLNIVSRRRIELIRRTLDLEGGWKPGR